MIPKEDTEGKTSTTTTPTIVHNFQSTDNKVIVSSDHPTNEQEFKEYIEEHPDEAPIIEKTVVMEDDTNKILTNEEKKEIIETAREKKTEETAQRKKDNAVLDNMGLKDAYGDTFVEGDDIYTISKRTGEKVDIGDVRSDAAVFDSYGFKDSGSGVRILDPSTGISEEGVFEDGEWKPQGTKQLLEEPTVTTRTTYDPFKMMVPVTDNYGKLENKPAWVLSYDTRIVYEPGGSGYELAVGPTGKKLDLWGGYDPQRGVFVVTTNKQYSQDVDQLGELMIGRGNLINPENDLQWYYGKSRLDEFKNYAVSPVTKRTYVDVTDSKKIITYDIGSYDIADFNVNDFKKGGDVTLKEKLPSTVMVGGELNNNNNIKPVVKKDIFGQTPDAMFYFDPQIEKKIQWGGANVKVDTLSYGLFEFGDKVNQGATSLSNMLPAGHVRNIGGAVIKTGAGIPSGLIMAGSAVVMETQIAAQNPAAVVNVFKGTPGFMVEQKQQAYADNPEESIASDALAVGIIGYGGFKMAGVKTLTSPKAIKAPELGVKGNVESYTQPKTSLFKSNIEGGYKRVITLDDGTKAYTNEVVARFAPTAGESAAEGELLIKGDSTIRSVSKSDVHKYWSKLEEIKPDTTDGPATSLDYTPKRMVPTAAETLAEDARMNTRSMRVKRDAARYWNKLTDLEKDRPNISGDLTGIEPNVKSNMQGIEIEPRVYDYSRVTPTTIKLNNVKSTLLEAYLKNSRTRAGDVLSKQELIYEPPRTVTPKINTGNVFKISSPGILPSVSAYKLPQKTVVPQSLVFDTSVKVAPVIKPSSKISSKLVTGTSSMIKSGTKTGTKALLSAGLTTGAITIAGAKMAQSHAYKTPKFYTLGSGGAYGRRRSPANFDKHLWRNAGVLSEYMDGLNLDMSMGEPKKRKKSRRKGGKR